jgi:hypothetical protein
MGKGSRTGSGGDGMVIIRKTPYSQENQDFSDKGHICAQRDIYPLIFPNSELQFIPLPDEQARTLDADMGMDRRVLVKVHTLRESFQVMVQERFRGINWANKQDITITEWNNNSNQPGELYKIKSEMFLYAYYNAVADRFLEAIAFSVLNLKIKLAQGTINYTVPAPNKRSNQSFLCFKFDDLEEHHIAVFRQQWGDDGQRIGRYVNPYISPKGGEARARTRSYVNPRGEA